MTDIVELFPYPGFRDKQEALLKAADAKLNDSDIDTVIICAPVGVGKSGINVTLARKYGPAFYTTPQKKLRSQLSDDDDLNPYVDTVKARRDYRCGVTKDTCDECRINLDPEERCGNYNQCTYWNAKTKAMRGRIASITFAYLIVDGYIEGDGGFSDRNLLIVDEAHNLPEQTAALYAGCNFSPYNLPQEVHDDEFESLNPKTVDRPEQIQTTLERIDANAETFISEYGEEDDDKKIQKSVKQCQQYRKKHGYIFSQIDNDNDWVATVDSVLYKRQRKKSVEMKPISVSGFLRHNVWNRANNHIISTATMPYYKQPEKWCRALGIDSERTAIIKVGMSFPKKNRPIYTGYSIAEMSNKGDIKHWDEIMQTINKIAAYHEGEQGLIHSASYKRADRFIESSIKYPQLKGNVALHTQDENSEHTIRNWQQSDQDILISPSMTDGIDLSDDMCRWQVLLKVPFPSIGDNRVSYLLNESPSVGWPWYYEQAGVSIVQSVGRAVRSPDDYASYYVLDESFDKVRSHVDFPPWFSEAIVNKRQNSVLNW